jgi:mannosyltransferase
MELAEQVSTQALARPQDLPGLLRGWLQRHWPYLAIVAVTTALYLTQLTRYSTWLDENFSITLAYQPWPVFWHYVAGPEQNMMLYYLVLRAWLWVAGLFHVLPVEWIVRLPSLPFAVGSVICVFALGRRFFSATVGWIAAIVFALSSNTLYYAQEARSYSLHFFLVSLGWYCLFAALTTRETPQAIANRWWIAFALTMSLSVYAHLISIVYIAAQVMFVLALMVIPNSWQADARRNMRAIGVSTLGIAILTAPILLLAGVYGNSNSWIPKPGFGDLFLFFYWYVTGYAPPVTLTFYLFTFVGIGLLIASVRNRNNSTEQRSVPASSAQHVASQSGPALGLLFWFLVPTTLAFIASAQFGQHIFFPRYEYGTLAAFCLLVGFGVAAIPWRWPRVAASVCAGLLALTTLPGAFTPGTGGFRAATQWMEQRYQPGDGVLCVTDAIACSLQLDYYLNRVNTVDGLRYSADAPGQFRWVTTGNVEDQRISISPFNIALYTNQHHRFFVVMDDNPLTAQEQREKAAALQWIASNCTLIDQVTSHTADVQMNFTVEYYELNGTT